MPWREESSRGELFATNSRRQVAWVTSAHGAETYRKTSASAQTRLRTGERAAGAVPWAQLKAELGLAG